MVQPLGLYIRDCGFNYGLDFSSPSFETLNKVKFGQTFLHKLKNIFVSDVCLIRYE